MIALASGCRWHVAVLTAAPGRTGVTPRRFADTVASSHKKGGSSMRLLCSTLAFVLLHAAPAAADGRVALLIGNAGYTNHDFVLANPGNDVRALDDALRRLDFEVRSAIDLSREEMVASLDWLSETARDADIAMVFFAGHSIQVGSENYAIGVDLAELSAPAVARSSITLTEIRAAIEAADADLSIIVLDACRNNPLGDAEIGEVGLSAVSGGVGTLVAYSTDPGNVAADGIGDNSTFTEALLDHIETPGLDVRIMFGRVRQDVVRDTGGQQIPWVEEAVIGEHYLARGAPPLDTELRIWREAVAAGTVDNYQGYLEEFPEGLYKIMAELRIDGLRGVPLEAEDLADEDLPQATAALEMLGYFVPKEPATSDEDVRRAFARWRGTQPAGGRTFDALMREAARTATFLGTYTVSVVRSDLARHSSIQEQLRIAEENLAVAEADYGDNAEARDVLANMRREVEEIEEIGQRAAASLDSSRTYYNDLVEQTDRHFVAYMSDEAQPRFAASRALSGTSSRALADARTFYSHLELMRDAPDGSYAWLAAMMKEN